MTGILFDLDGTLLNTLDDLMDGVNHVLTRFGYPTRSREEIRCFVGNGAAKLMQLAVPQGADWQEPLEVFQVYYREHCQIKTAPYPGIPEALTALSKKYPLAIVSNKPDAATKKLCARHPCPGRGPRLPKEACGGYGLCRHERYWGGSLCLCGGQRGGRADGPERRSPMPQRTLGVPG